MCLGENPFKIKLILFLNKTWVFIDLPQGPKPIVCKQIYTRKHNLECSIDKYKSRLVLRFNSEMKS